MKTIECLVCDCNFNAKLQTNKKTIIECSECNSKMKVLLLNSGATQTILKSMGVIKNGKK